MERKAKKLKPLVVWKVASATKINVWLHVPLRYTKENFPVGDEDIPTPGKINHWKYLEGIADKITPGKDIGIGILISGIFSKVLESLEVIPSKDGGPYAFVTLLDWCLVGPIGDQPPIQQCHKKRCQFKQKSFTLLTKHCSSQKKAFTEMSEEEHNFLTLMEKECSKVTKH